MYSVTQYIQGICQEHDSMGPRVEKICCRVGMVTKGAVGLTATLEGLLNQIEEAA